MNIHESIPRVDILGVKISAIDIDLALDLIEDWVSEKIPNYICVTPAHAIMACYDDAKIRNIYNASGLTTPDGMPIVWLLRLYGYKHTQRVYGPDLLIATCKRFLSKGYKHYFYGGKPGVVETLVGKLKRMFPEIKIAGYESPPFRDLSPEEKSEMYRRIGASEADILWVGLGSPKQEIWMQENIYHLNTPVVVGVGAAFDFCSGLKPQAPRWIQHSGLEWFFRLVCEPTRLWKRYMLGYPRFIFLIIRQLIMDHLHRHV